MRIRKATSNDVELLIRLRIAFLQDMRGVPCGEDFVEQTRVLMREHQERGALHSWLAEDQDQRCGGVVSLLLFYGLPLPEERRELEGVILNMYVTPPDRRRGVGRALLDTCIAEGTALGVRRFSLRATTDGRAMYQQAGFAPDPDALVLRTAQPAPRTAAQADEARDEHGLATRRADEQGHDVR